MSLISRLGRRFREKPKSTNLNLPSLPTPREILEDIESCPNNDSIITLATLIQKKGRQSLLDNDFLKDTSSNTTQQTHLDFLTPYQISETDDKLQSDDGKATTKASKGKGATTGPQSGPKSKKGEADQINSYNKLKQFLLLYEKSEELLEGLEPHFKRIETALKTCNEFSPPPLQPDTDDNDKESLETDLCSSPLL